MKVFDMGKNREQYRSAGISSRLIFTDLRLKDPCTEDHDWKDVGGRTYPRWEEAYVEGIRLYCSQIVYRCTRCGTYDYGEPGGPSFKECNDMCGPLEKP